MGLPTDGRNLIRTRYNHAVSFKRPGNPSVVIYDLMKDIKVIGKDVYTMDQLISHFTEPIKRIMSNPECPIRVMIILVDKAPPIVKQLVTHVERYKRIQKLNEEGAPYLSSNPNGLVPKPWIEFAANYRLCQRELYPRLFNAFMDGIHVPLKPGQQLILHGFPAYSELKTNYNPRIGGSKIRVMHRWSEVHELPITEAMEERDPDLYNRVWRIESVPESLAPNGQKIPAWIYEGEWEAAKNKISESDAAMFFYDHWFQNEDIMFICNDGDIIPYAILYSYERIKQADNSMRNNHILCLPYKMGSGKKKKGALSRAKGARKSKNDEKADSIRIDDEDSNNPDEEEEDENNDEEFDAILELFHESTKPRWEYFDTNKLYCLIQNDPAFIKAGVQNHELTMAFLLLLPGSDFFKHAFKRLSAKRILWPVFFANLKLFSHMVQSSKAVRPNTRTRRDIVLDEDLFRHYGIMCYVECYGKGARKRARLALGDTTLSLDQLKDQCNGTGWAQKDPACRFPSRNQFRLWARQLLYNMRLYRDTPLGPDAIPNPLEKWDDLPYYPYILNPITQVYEMTEMVSASQKPVDEFYWRHFYRKKAKNLKRPREN